jgi:hypothetical protein
VVSSCSISTCGFGYILLDVESWRGQAANTRCEKRKVASALRCMGLRTCDRVNCSLLETRELQLGGALRCCVQHCNKERIQNFHCHIACSNWYRFGATGSRGRQQHVYSGPSAASGRLRSSARPAPKQVPTANCRHGHYCYRENKTVIVMGCSMVRGSRGLSQTDLLVLKQRPLTGT